MTSSSRAQDVIEVSDLHLRLGDRVVLRGVSFTVKAGTTFCLLGRNGAGKTSVIRILLGLIAPSGGTVRTLGFDPAVDGTRVRAACGQVLEHTGLYEQLTAAENLEFAARAWCLDRTVGLARIESLLRRADLWDRRDERVATWSPGMRQRLAVARARLAQPALLVLDEPTSGLDPIAADDFWRDLRTTTDQLEATVLVTTHNLTEASTNCDQAAVLDKGEIVAVGSPRSLLQRDTGARCTQQRSPRLEKVFRDLVCGGSP